MDEKIMELQGLVKELREKFEEKEKGIYTKAEFEEFEKKVNERIAEIETAMKRPIVGGNEEKKVNESKAVFFKFMREGRAALSPEERKQLVEDATGQILVPEHLEAEIYRALPKISVVRGLANVMQTRSDRVRRRSLTEVQVGWGKLETGATLTESTLVPSEAFLYVEDLYGLTKIGEDEMMDTDVALTDIITDSFSRAIAETEDTGFILGRGHTYQEPEGILNGAVVGRVPAGQAAAIKADDIIKLIYEVPAQYRRNGVLIVNSKTELALRLLKGTDGQYLWQPSLQAGRPNTFAGVNVYNQDDVPEIPETGAADVAIFGDIFSGYKIVDRLGMTIQRLNELYSEDGLIGFKAHYRVGGGVVRPEALKILNVPSA